MRRNHPHPILLLAVIILSSEISIVVQSFTTPNTKPYRSDLAFSPKRAKKASHTLLHEGENDEQDEAAQFRAKAEQIREEIRNLEGRLDRTAPSNNNAEYMRAKDSEPKPAEGMSLTGKTVLVVGANGRLGSMVCRHLLRNNPKTEVVAAVHTVSENSSTSRGYGRLSYEVGAEDGVGTIGAAWSSEEDRTASFMWSEEMRDYNLQNLRLVEVELLDPVQCQTVTEGVDCVVWCATDFDGNTPRAVSGFNIAFLFRAVADPTKGRVEVEGLRNILGGLKNAKQSVRWKQDRIEGLSATSESAPAVNSGDPISFVHVSTSEDALPDFETPFGTFKDQKRQGEAIVMEEFPSLTHCVLQMGKYDDNFVGESLDVMMKERIGAIGADIESEDANAQKRPLRINRRDAARAAADALVDETIFGKKVEVWTV